MDLSRLLNDPRPPKRPRLFALLPGQSADSDESQPARQHSAVHLPMDMIAYVMRFIDAEARPDYRLVNQAWYAAYNRYHRYCYLGLSDDISLEPEQLISAMHCDGLRLRYICVWNTMLAALFILEPNLSTRTIPNVSTAIIFLTSDDVDSDLWLLEACRGWKRLKCLGLNGGYCEPDSDFANNLNQLLCFTPELHTLAFTDVGFENLGSVQLDTAKLPQLTALNVSLENLTTPSELVSFLEPLHNLDTLGLDEVNSLHMLDAVANIVEQANFAPKMKSFSVSTGMDLVKTPPAVIREVIEVDVQDDTGDGSVTAEQRTITRTRKVTVIDTMNRFRDLNRPQLQLVPGFILGACSCSTSHPFYHQYIESERQFLVEFGTKCIPRLDTMKITHYTPSVPGFYWPLDALFHDGVSFPWLSILLLHITPMSWFKDRLARILGDRVLLPRLTGVEITYEDTSDIDVDYFAENEIDNRDGILTIVCLPEPEPINFTNELDELEDMSLG
ncbi:hypothetical protein GQ42DRAFT_177810 [Ramicandelaber brevisporus]|nr:hypothetical protein GQ42DRAFT_177810 [Ramicandelaber brevisporus]